MEWVKLVECLEFQQEPTWQNEIHAIAAFELSTFVEQRQLNLTFVSDSKSPKFKAQSLLVVCLIQSRTEFTMHSHSSSDNPAR